MKFLVPGFRLQVTQIGEFTFDVQPVTWNLELTIAFFSVGV